MEAWTAAAISADLPAEHGDQEGHAEGQAEEGVVEQHLVPAVLGQVLGVADDLLAVLGDPAVEHGVAELDQGVAEDDGRVRVALLVGVGVVLAVHRHPLPGSGARRHPDDEAAGEGDRRPHGDGLVGQRPVQVHRRDDEGDLGGHQPDQDGLEDRGHVVTTLAQPKRATAAAPPGISRRRRTGRLRRAAPIRAKMCGFRRRSALRGALHELHPLRPAGPGRLHRPRSHLRPQHAGLRRQPRRRGRGPGRPERGAPGRARRGLARRADLRLRRRAGGQRPGGGRGGGAAPHPAARRGRHRAPRLRLARQPAEADGQRPCCRPADGGCRRRQRPAAAGHGELHLLRAPGEAEGARHVG